MCENQDAVIAAIDGLRTDFNRYIKLCEERRKPYEYMQNVRNNRKFLCDLRGRKHLFIYSALPLTLTADVYGIFTVAANTWTSLPFKQDDDLTVTNQVSDTAVFLRATDEMLP